METSVPSKLERIPMRLIAASFFIFAMTFFIVAIVLVLLPQFTRDANTALMMGVVLIATASFMTRIFHGVDLVRSAILTFLFEFVLVVLIVAEFFANRKPPFAMFLMVVIMNIVGSRQLRSIGWSMRELFWVLMVFGMSIFGFHAFLDFATKRMP